MESILGTLGLNWPAFIWHSVNFLVLLFLMWRVLYKPVTRILDERERRVRESLERVDEVRRQAEESEAARQALLAETRREAEQIRARADEQAKHILAQVQVTAEEQRNRILEQSRAETEAARQQMIADVRAHVADLVVTAVDRVTRQALDERTQRSLVQQFLSTETPNGSAAVTRGPV